MTLGIVVGSYYLKSETEKGLSHHRSEPLPVLAWPSVPHKSVWNLFCSIIFQIFLVSSTIEYAIDL
jgi:hypothetical protein